MSDEEVTPEKAPSDFNLEQLEAAPPEPPPPTGGLRLTMGVPEGAHVVVEIAGAEETVVYDQGEVQDGMLDLKFPNPPEGDAIIRVVTLDPETGQRTALHSEMM